MSAPTRDEIIAEIHGKMAEGANGEGGLTAHLGRVIDDYAMWIRHPAWHVLECPDPRDDYLEEEEESLWWDLRPSEAIALLEHVRAAQARLTAECETLIIEGIADATEAFAREHPEAPRGRPKSVAA
jgi:hypothetical protein